MDQLGVKICPFNQNHVVPLVSFQNHVIRCKKKYSGRKVPCPYMACEYMYPEELQEHLTKCEYSPHFVPTGKLRGAFPATQFEHDLPIDSEDDWD